MKIDGDTVSIILFVVLFFGGFLTLFYLNEKLNCKEKNWKKVDDFWVKEFHYNGYHYTCLMYPNHRIQCFRDRINHNNFVLVNVSGGGV